MAPLTLKADSVELVAISVDVVLEVDLDLIVHLVVNVLAPDTSYITTEKMSVSMLIPFQ